MVSAIFSLMLLSVGFAAGYFLRASISRRRRAAAREEWLRRLDQKRYDDGGAASTSSVVFSISDEALAAALIGADKLAQLRPR
jgi:hypothetical protein